MSRITETGKPVSGTSPMVMVGVVEDNVDPEGLGRIKIKYPTQPTNPQSFWSRQISPNGGAVGGVYALPEKNDEVLVAFLQGSQDHPIILGQFWNGKTKPPKESADGMPGSDKTDIKGQLSKDKFNDGSTDIQKNDRRFWRSRAGHLFVFDDTKGKETVQMWDGTHTMAFVMDSKDSRVILSNTKGDIHIRSKQDIYLEAGRDIKFRAGQHVLGESVQKTQHKAGTDILVESVQKTHFTAGTDFNVDAKANINLNAKVNVKISGVMFAAKGSNSSSVEGASSVTVRGGNVAIN